MCVFLCAYTNKICSLHSKPELDCFCAFPQDEEQNELSSATAGECFHFLVTEKDKKMNVNNKQPPGGI